ncbi:MAG: cytochrome c [Candidatus Acidiferrales bacterium]
MPITIEHAMGKGIGYRGEALCTSRSGVFGINWKTVEETMAIRSLVLLSALLSIACVASAGPVDQTQFPLNYVPSGEQMYTQYCAACHGANAKGNGPLASLLKVAPSDLTTLAKRHAGKFPYDYVSSVLKFGPGLPAHGSSDMPTWGPLFRYFDKQNERVVQQRIKNLCNYLASLQGK